MSITSVLPLRDQNGDTRHFCVEHRELFVLLPAATTAPTMLAVFVHAVLTSQTWGGASLILRLELCRRLTASATFTGTGASAITSRATLVSMVEALAAWGRANVILDDPEIARVLTRPRRLLFVRVTHCQLSSM
jgi:hypothetical protein